MRKRWIGRCLAWTLVAAGVAGGQRPGIDGPPACPAPAAIPQKGLPVQKGVRPPERARPSVASARATAEAEAADASVLVSAEPMENFGVSRYRLAEYADCVGTSGCYWRDLDAQLQRAQFALRAVLAQHRRDEKLALVLDIDETTLSSYCEMKREDFGYISRMFNDWVVTPEAAVGIPGTLRLFREARAEGVAVFFLTGRPGEQQAATERNLRAVGFEGWAGVVLRSPEQRDWDTATYKAAARQKMADAGYRLVLSVGDQWSDLTGLPRAELSVKLPNPFYYLP